MVINDVITITDDLRTALSHIFESQLHEIEHHTNELLTYTDIKYSHEFEYHNLYTVDHNNLIRSVDGHLLMSVFNFNNKNTSRIFKLLDLSKHRPKINGIRVYSNSELPMHMDLNKGEIGRDNPIYSIVLSGSDGTIFISNNSDGSKLVALPGLSEFVMYPTLIQHGAKSRLEHIDVLQIQLSALS